MAEAAEAAAVKLRKKIFSKIKKVAQLICKISWIIRIGEGKGPSIVSYFRRLIMKNQQRERGRESN